MQPRLGAIHGGYMFGRIGIGQILIILAIFVVLFGYKKLPELGKGLGQALRNFKKSVEEPDEIDITPEKKADPAHTGTAAPEPEKAEASKSEVPK